MAKEIRTDLIMALEQLECEKGISKDEILETINQALISALRKNYGKTAQIMAGLNTDTGELEGYLQKKVVDEVFTPELEISLDEAVKYNPSVSIGEDVFIPIDTRDYHRIAAQAAKQNITNKVRDIEKQKIFDEFKPREGEIINGMVHHIVGRDIFVDLGKTEAILPFSEQIRREHYNTNQRVRAVIQKVEKENRGPQIVLSRRSPEFLKALFATEVPEIAENLIEIKAVVRDAGFRAKVLVSSNSPKIDPVGACVGVRGSRIRIIMNELSGEKIDLIPYIEDELTLIAHALSPAVVNSVRVIDKEHKMAMVTVSDDQLAMAIGREGQNIRLASSLTGWEIKVESETQRAEAVKREKDVLIQELMKVEGVGLRLAENLVTMGVETIAQLAELQESVLQSIEGIGEKTAQKILAGAKKIQEDLNAQAENEDTAKMEVEDNAEEGK